MGSWLGVLGLGLCFQYYEEIKAKAEICVNQRSKIRVIRVLIKV
jgi:hypothetical protein